MAEQNIQIGTTVLVLTPVNININLSRTMQTYLSMIKPMKGDNNIWAAASADTTRPYSNRDTLGSSWVKSEI